MKYEWYKKHADRLAYDLSTKCDFEVESREELYSDNEYVCAAKEFECGYIHGQRMFLLIAAGNDSGITIEEYRELRKLLYC